MDNMDLSIEEIKDRIDAREAEGRPVGKLRAALSAKNRALNVTKSSSEIRAEIDARRSAGKPTRQLEEELASRH